MALRFKLKNNTFEKFGCSRSRLVKLILQMLVTQCCFVIKDISKCTSRPAGYFSPFFHKHMRSITCSIVETINGSILAMIAWPSKICHTRAKCYEQGPLKMASGFSLESKIGLTGDIGVIFQSPKVHRSKMGFRTSACSSIG